MKIHRPRIKRPRKRLRSSRKSLTLLFSIVTFMILLAVTLVIGGIILILIETGALAILTENLFGWTFVLLITFSLIIGAGITYLLGKLMMKPMNKIINTMNELAYGNYKARLHLSGMLESNPSFKELIDSFNEMAEELDHTEILRSDFVNNFSHEFKTPIVSISGFAKLLKEGNLTEEQRAEYTDIILEESIRLSDMATGVLNLSRIENQTILTGVTKYNLSEQLRFCILLLEEKWTKKNLEIDPEFDEYDIEANEEHMRQVWINILDNAVKFANEGGKIAVRIEKDGDTVHVQIENTGSAIPPEERDRIFVKFYQIDKSHASAGNGIGLAVVKKIVSLHGGAIACHSEDGRTAFNVSMPLHQ